MSNMFALLLTLVVGLFIVFGALLVVFTKNNDKFMNFSISVAFGVMVSLALLELIPESFELIGPLDNTIVKIIFYTSLGFILLTVLDRIVPHHDHGHSEHDGEEHNMLHIGLVSSIALILHNIIEGMALYGTALESRKIGALVALGIGLHNIPMGMVITSAFQKGHQNKLNTMTIITFTSLSTFLGGLIMFIMKTSVVNDYVVGILICLTLGMLIYIAFLELLPQMLCKKNKKISVLGIITGVAILIISQLF